MKARYFAMTWLIVVAGCTPPATQRNAIKAQVEPAPEFREIGPNGQFAMLIPSGLDPGRFDDLARERCGAREFCMVIGWTDPAVAARALPMTDREVTAQAFIYTLNRTTGFEQGLWDCRRFRRAAAECMAEP
jgi:hypothetical protein